jgi:hypothetical protein
MKQAFSRKAVVSLPLSVLLLVAAAPRISGVALDTEGRPVMHCTGTLVEHSVTQGSGAYRFKGQCSTTEGDRVYNVSYEAAASWNGSTKKASEVVKLPNGTKGFTSSICPNDPWLYNSSCTAAAVSGPAFDTYKLTATTRYPLSAGLLSSAQRAALIKEASTAKPKPTVPPPPPPPKMTIVSPQQNQSFKGDVLLHVKAIAAVKQVKLRWWWVPETKPKEWPKTPEEKPLLATLAMHDGVGKALVANAQFDPPGKWRVRVVGILDSKLSVEETRDFSVEAVKSKSLIVPKLRPIRR